MPNETSHCEQGEDRLLTREEAAKKLRISPRLLWSLTYPRGPIPCIRFRTSVRYSNESLIEYINQEFQKLAEEKLDET